VADQAAAFLRERIVAGHWPDKLPGIQSLAEECRISPVTMRAGVRLLEKGGWIRNSGSGKNRVAAVPEGYLKKERKHLNITILPGLPIVDEDSAFQRLVMDLQHQLEGAGHQCRIAPTSQEQMGHDCERIARYVKKNPADAWVVIGGRTDVVSWFSRHSEPAICIGGGVLNEPIASTGMIQDRAFDDALSHLVALGHRRIIFLWPLYRLDPTSDHYIKIFGKVLTKAGTGLSAYHVPAWKPDPRSLHAVLEKSFRFTPPTAIVTTYGKWMAGVLSFLADRGLKSPKDVSLLSMNEDDWFSWQIREISCLRGDDTLMVQRILRWTKAIQHGKADKEFIGFPQEWHRGETIGPVPK